MPKKEKGQALVLVALLLVVVFGMAALSVDVTMEQVRATILQKAADAAALAAASDSSNAQPAALAMLQANRIPPADYAGNWFTTSGAQYTVTLSEANHFIFAPAMGFKTVQIVRSSTAEVTTGSGNGSCPWSGYAIFNGSNSQALQLGGNGSISVSGDVHSNNDVDFENNGSVAINGNVTLDGSIVNQSRTSISGKIQYNSSIPLPDYSSFLQQLQTEAQANKTDYPNGYPNNGIIGGDGSDVISGPIYVNGSVTIKNNGSISQNTCIYASGGITVKSNGSATIGTYSPNGISFALYSGSDITLENNGSVTVYGLLYAPNGSIDVNDNGSTSVYGSIVAQRVTNDNNGSISVDYSSLNSGFQYYPQTQSQTAHLVK